MKRIVWIFIFIASEDLKNAILDKKCERGIDLPLLQFSPSVKN
jgi:hypothetical protein